MRNRTHLLLEVSNMLKMVLIIYGDLDVLKLLNELFCNILTLKNWDCIAQTFSRLTNKSTNLASRVHAQGSRVHNSQTLDLEVVEEDLSHLLPVLLWIKRRIGHENVDIFGFEIELVENVAPH